MKEREGDIKDSKADISLIQKTMNFSPDIQLEEGLKHSIEWYKKQIQNVSSSPIGQ